MAKDKVDIDNFMGVIQATQQTEEGLVFPGEHMFSGNPVTSPGASLADIMGDRGMAEQWHNAIKGQYEREKSERDNPRSLPDTPDLVIGGGDAPADDGGGSSSPAQVHPAQAQEELPEAPSLEAVLERRVERETLNCVTYRQQMIAATDRYEDAQSRLRKAEAALEAILGV